MLVVGVYTYAGCWGLGWEFTLKHHMTFLWYFVYTWNTYYNIVHVIRPSLPFGLIYCGPNSSNPDPIGLSNCTSKVMCILLKQCPFISCPLASLVQCGLKGLSLLAVLRPAFQAHRGLLFSPWVPRGLVVNGELYNMLATSSALKNRLQDELTGCGSRNCWSSSNVAKFQLAFFRIIFETQTLSYAAIARVLYLNQIAECLPSFAEITANSWF